MLINKCELPVRKHFNDSRTSIEYSNDIDDIYQNIEGYNRNEKWKILIIFNNNIADVHSNKKLNPIVTDFFIRGRKLNIILLFLLHNIFCVPRNMELNSTHYLIMKIQKGLIKIRYWI